ncbi:sigma-70 family RNA polymerase sigma factor [Streptomyces sp. ACA25]|uniref:sigma-70 family RNA polymerase sigma factor n=1 Tax=Streptomyces sp. ACA25 TaxID=3022596 RepID=UPI002307340A|nr:sigma-70 family RNA polymerase sigma factor [Streptomyces sp. ACA25]MDB1090071.1 sigma-70 family RNA polymerase sigma factor [Streptomyces sp. ACA25]
MTENAEPLSDLALITRTRDGDDSGFEELYRRHAESVRRYARLCCRDAQTAEDLTAEVFARTLQRLRSGGGPEASVRAYLLTTVRRVAAAWGAGGRREQLVDDFPETADPTSGPAESPSEASAMRKADNAMVVRAYHSLPERWQAVLWHVVIEGEPPRKVAPLLGLSSNATAVLAHRAREGLRQAYLQAHVSERLTDQEECRGYAGQLGEYTRKTPRLRGFRLLRRHLGECEHCRAAHLELVDVNARLRDLLPVAFLGWFAAPYLTGAAKAGGAGASGGYLVGTGAVAAEAAPAGAAIAGAAGAGAAAASGGVFGKLAVTATLALAAGVAVNGSQSTLERGVPGDRRDTVVETTDSHPSGLPSGENAEEAQREGPGAHPEEEIPQGRGDRRSDCPPFPAEASAERAAEDCPPAGSSDSGRAPEPPEQAGSGTLPEQAEGRPEAPAPIQQDAGQGNAQGTAAQGVSGPETAAQGRPAQGASSIPAGVPAAQGGAAQGGAAGGRAAGGGAAQGSAAQGTAASQGSAAQGSAAQGSAAQGSAAQGNPGAATGSPGGGNPGPPSGAPDGGAGGEPGR